MIRFAVVSNTEKGLQQFMDDLNRVTQDSGMKTNVKKTRDMCVCLKGNCRMKIQIDGELVKQVSNDPMDGSCKCVMA